MTQLSTEVRRLYHEAQKAPRSDYRRGYLDALEEVLEILEEEDA